MPESLTDETVQAFNCDGPLPYPPDWLEIVNRPQTETELEALRHCVNRGQPLDGSDCGSEPFAD